jgi:hypothetical protein
LEGFRWIYLTQNMDSDRFLWTNDRQGYIKCGGFANLLKICYRPKRIVLRGDVETENVTSSSNLQYISQQLICMVIRKNKDVTFKPGVACTAYIFFSKLSRVDAHRVRILYCCIFLII